MPLSTLTKYNQVPTSSALYWPNRTKYQPVPPYTDLWNQVTTNAAMPLSSLYWPSTPKYQQVLPSTDPVPPRTNQYLKKYQLADLRGIILMHIKGRVWPGLTVTFFLLSKLEKDSVAEIYELSFQRRLVPGSLSQKK